MARVLRVGALSPAGASPVAKLLMVLQALLNGTPVDMVAVKWLWMRIATGDFVNGGFPMDAPKLALKNLDKEVSAALALMLGPVHTRRGSKLADMDTDSHQPPRYSFLLKRLPAGKRCKPRERQ